MSKIYVVIGGAGAYSDHTEWLVRAFKSEDKAKEFVLKLSEEERQIRIVGDSHVPNPDYNPSSFYDRHPMTLARYTEVFTSWLEKHDIKKLDPDFTSYYSDGVSYTYYDVELEE